MTDLLTGSGLTALVLGFRRTAFRLETRDDYREAEEAEPLRCFLAGRPDYSWNDDWAELIARRSAEGARMRRVRIVSEPHTDYTRFLLDLARVNVAAGEDIRYLPRRSAERLGLPSEDFWLIDGETVAVLSFREDGAFRGAEIRTDRTAVAEYAAVERAAWAQALPLLDYTS